MDLEGGSNRKGGTQAPYDRTHRGKRCDPTAWAVFQEQSVLLNHVLAFECDFPPTKMVCP